MRTSTTTALQFQIPDELIDGAYFVAISALDSGGQAHISSGGISVQHGTSPWTWNIAKAAENITWTPVPDARSYEVQISSVNYLIPEKSNTAAASMRFHRVATILPNDTYMVSVQATLPNGVRTAPGVANSSGEIVLKRMIVGGAPKSVVITSSRISWNAVTGATKYDIWIDYVSPGRKTERILRRDAYGLAIPLPANLTSRAGEYRVWVRAIRSEAGQDYVGRWSDVKTLTVGAASRTLNTGAWDLVMSELATSGL